MSRDIRSPVYQIDFTAVDAGKRVASTKRRIRWRFGFTNQDALAAGETGTACRGEEHDITLIWSLTSGKRLVLADGQEVHYSNSRSQIFDFSWTMRGNHVLKVVAHATTPLNAHPNFRQYEFFVDGMSFFSMPKVYRLGLTGADPVQEPGTLALAHSSRRQNYGNYTVDAPSGFAGGGVHHGAHSVTSPRGQSSIVEIEAPHNAQEEEAYLREAIKASLSQDQAPPAASSSVSYNAPMSAAPRQEEDLLIDFMSEPGPAPAPAPTGPDSFAMVVAQAPPAAIYAPSYAFSPDPQQAAPMPMQSAPDPFFAPPMAPVPVHNQSFAAPPVPPPMAPAYAPAPFAAPPAPVAEPEPAPFGAPVLTMAPKFSNGLGSDANAAYAKFASMDQFDLVKPKAGDNRSNPFDDPVTSAPVGTLRDMKAKNPGNGEKKEVMKSSMVIAQQQGGSWGGGGGGYNNYGMQMGGAPPAAPVQGQYGRAPPMGGGGIQPPMQQAAPQQQYPQYGSQYGGFAQPPMQQGQQPQYGMPQGQQYQQPQGQQYQQPQQGYGQPQQPF